MTYVTMKSYRKDQKNLSIFHFIYFKVAFLDGLSGSEDVNLHLLFRNAKDVGYVAIALTLHVSQLHATTLLLG